VVSASAAGYYFLTPHGPRSDAKASVIIAGGGAAGISIASRLRRALPNAQITVVDPATEHYYQPGFTLIACGELAPADVVRRQSSLIPKGVRWVQDAVTALDPDRKRLETSRHGGLSYDFLVLCPGLQMNFSAIEGLRREDLGRGNVHCIYDFAGAHKCWDAIQRLAKTGGRAYFTDTWTKLKCGGAPKKINMLAEDYCRRVGVRDRVDIQMFTAADQIYDVPAFARRLEQIYAERKIPVTMEHRVKKIDAAARRITFEDRRATPPVMVTHEFDFLHIVPPMCAPDFVKASPISVNPATGQREDWVPTDPATLRHSRYADVYVAGDVAGIPTSKTAAAVRMQAPVLAANLTAAIDGRTPPARYNGYTACPFATEYGKVLMAEFGYDKKPAPTIPFLDPAREHRAGWILKRYVLKPMYFELMLRGRA